MTTPAELDYLIEEAYQWLADAIGGELVYVFGDRPGLYTANHDDAHVRLGKYPQGLQHQEELTLLSEELPGWQAGGGSRRVDIYTDKNQHLIARTKIGSAGTTYPNFGYFDIDQENLDRLRELDKIGKDHIEAKRWVYDPDPSKAEVIKRCQICGKGGGKGGTELGVYAVSNDGTLDGREKGIARHLGCIGDAVRKAHS